MKFKNMELIKHWNTLENRAIVYNLYDSENVTGHSLEEKMDCCNLAKITGEPSRCGVASRGAHKGLQVFFSTGHEHSSYTVLELTMKVLGSDFANFVKSFTNFFYNADSNADADLTDFNESLVDVCSANYGMVSVYGSIKGPGLKAFIKRDKDVLKVLKAVYTTALSISWYVNPTDQELPCTRMSYRDISEKTGVKERKVTNILTILRLMHAIAEVPTNRFSKPYFERYIDSAKVWMHKPVYVVFPLAKVDWSLVNTCEFTANSVISQSSVTYWFGDDIAQEVFVDKVNHSIQLTLMMAFGDIIGCTNHSLSVKTVKDTALSIVQNEVSDIIPDETVSSAWKSFQLFLPWSSIKMVTNSRAEEENKNGLAKPNERVLIPASN